MGGSGIDSSDIDSSGIDGSGTRSARTSATREALLSVAERLYAEEGLHTVSNRHVSEAAGQGNNAAVAYHFGSKADLVRAIVDRHSGAVEETRTEMVEHVGESERLEDWVSCLIRPYTDHLATLGVPSWYGRFNVQLLADPSLRTIVYEQATDSVALRSTLDGLDRSLPNLPLDVRRARREMVRSLMMHVCAEKELEFSQQHPERPPSWADCGTDLIDATVGLWRAPVSRR
nr:TetR/AcrR family transcriptional regulator [Rhodococcus sp. (in: high G+C Gram-positive bacteria)]